MASGSSELKEATIDRAAIFANLCKCLKSLGFYTDRHHDEGGEAVMAPGVLSESPSVPSIAAFEKNDSALPGAGIY